MKEKEIKEELELGVRAFLEAEERSKAEAADDFKEMRILECAFNRLFLAVEHFCNAVILFETGNYSKKHFGDFEKLKRIKEKYSLDLIDIYQQTYSFRSYGDYRKFPEVEEKFDREHLKEELSGVKEILKKCLNILTERLNINFLLERITENKEANKNQKIKDKK